MSAQSLVAAILAASVFVFILNGTLLRGLFGLTNEAGAAQAAAWKDIINVIVGALAGYIAGNRK